MKTGWRGCTAPLKAPIKFLQTKQTTASTGGGGSGGDSYSGGSTYGDADGRPIALDINKDGKITAHCGDQQHGDVGF